MTYDRLVNLKPSDYEHPGEKAAMAALKKIPLLHIVIAKYMDMQIKMSLKAESAGDNFRITEETNPRIYRLYKLAMARLDVKKEIPLYSHLSYDYNAYAAGAKENFIVVHSSCIKDFSDGEMLQLLGHEIGHVKSGHVLYHGVASMLNAILGSLGGVAQQVSVGLQYAIMDWSRMSEYTADRAGVIASADPEASLNQTLKLLGQSSKTKYIDFSVDSILNQVEEFNMETSDLIGKLLYANFTLNATHPWSILRLQHINEWGKSQQFEELIKNHMV